MNLWGRIFARFYDRCMASTEDAGLADGRRALLSGAHGSVIEIGAERLHQHLGRIAPPVRIVQAPASAPA